MTHRTSERKNTPLILISTLLIMYVITGLALIALAMLLYKMQIGETVVSAGIIAIYVVSCLIGGLIAGKRLRARKFLWGLLMGALYFAILLVGSFLLNHGVSSDGIHILTTLVMCMAAGMIGGMVG